MGKAFEVLVVVLAIIGFLHLIGVRFDTNGYVAVNYNPDCNCSGRGITPADEALLRSVYK